MQDIDKSHQLTYVFIGLLVDRIAPASIPNSKIINKIFLKLLKQYSFEDLWSAVYFSQEDDFWSEIVISVGKFEKHIEKLVVKGRQYQCPYPDEPTEPAVLPEKSLLQVHKERQRCQQIA